MSDSIDPEILKNLWRSRKIMTESILPGSGYDVSDEHLLTYEEFVKWAGDDSEATIRKAMTFICEKKSAKTPDKIIVFWLTEPKLGNNVRELIDEMKKNECNHSIVVVDDSVTHWAKAILRNLKQKKIFITTYTLKESLIDVTEHRLVPEHSICTLAEKKKLMDAYSVGPDDIPHIKITDPVVRQIGASRGQLLKIIRKSETQTGLDAITYRLVV